MKTRSSILTLAVGVLVAGGTILPASPALAADAAIRPTDNNDFLDGIGFVDDDLQDEPALHYGSRSDWVGVWQKILMANGDLDRGTVDCIFGQQTMNATKHFQQRNGLSIDGVAGPRTLRTAGILLTFHEYGDTVYYQGYVYETTVGVRSGGRYRGANNAVIRTDRISSAFPRC